MKIPNEIFKKEDPGRTLSFHAKADLVKKIESAARKSGAKSVSSYISALLEYVLKEEK